MSLGGGVWLGESGGEGLFTPRFSGIQEGKNLGGGREGNWMNLLENPVCGNPTVWGGGHGRRTGGTVLGGKDRPGLSEGIQSRFLGLPDGAGGGPFSRREGEGRPVSEKKDKEREKRREGAGGTQGGGDRRRGRGWEVEAEGGSDVFNQKVGFPRFSQGGVPQGGGGIKSAGVCYGGVVGVGGRSKREGTFDDTVS